MSAIDPKSANPELVSGRIDYCISCLGRAKQWTIEITPLNAPFAFSAATLLLLASVITVLLSARSLSALQNLHIHHYERRLREETTADLLDAFRHRHGLSETEVFVVVALLDHRIPGWRD